MKCPYCNGTGICEAKFNARLRAIRENHGLSQSDFCKPLPVGRAQIANLESGRGEPTSTVLVAIADTYDVSVDWLLGRDEE